MFSSATTLVFFTTIIGVIGNVGADCPKVQPAPIDEDWYFKQGETGFISIRAAGFTVDDLTKGVSTNLEQSAPFKGSKKSCWTASLANGGVKLPTDQQYKCTYNEANQFGCELEDKTGVVSKMNQLTLKFPSKLLMTIVATDNSTYVGISMCLDGSKPYWVVAATRKDASLPDADINKALGITDKDVEASKNNPIKASRFTPAQSECQAQDTIKNLNLINDSPIPVSNALGSFSI